MNELELKERISKLNIWEKGGQRAPHKPLLILYALGRLQQGGNRLINYEDVRQDLIDLLSEFGPYRRAYSPENPFSRLHKDGFWELSHKVEDKDIRNKWLLDNRISGGFSIDTYNLLEKNPSLVQEIAQMLLKQHFTDTMHEDILEAVGLDFNQDIKLRSARDPYFRDKILNAYEHRCAICGFNVRIGNNLVAVEAAHIKWHQAGGPDREENGIAMCSLHHKLFDRGVFAIEESRVLRVSEQAHGTSGFDEWVMKYHDREIKKPIRPDYEPNNEYTAWHMREVFKGQSRYVTR